MRAADVFEGIVKAGIPAHEQDKWMWSAVAYVPNQLNAALKGRYDPQLGYVNAKTDVAKWTTVSAKNYDRFIYNHKVSSKLPAAGVRTLLMVDNYYKATINKYSCMEMFVPCIDFLPGLDKNTREVKEFWDAISQKYPGKKLYLFESGSAHHGYMNCLMDKNTNPNWWSFLTKHKIVDQSWVDRSFDLVSRHYHQVIRTTASPIRPEPKFWKWVNL